MKKMETSETVDEYDSCRSSVISDLDELEANLYSYVHHEINSCFNEEFSTSFNVSSLEGVCQQNGIGVHQQNEISGENENFDHISFANRGLKLLDAKEICSESNEVNQHGELVDSACFVTRIESDSSCCFVQSSGNVVPVQLSDKKAKATSGICRESRESSPSVLEVSSSDDLDPTERNASKYKIPAASTPVKEFVVIDDSEAEVQIEFERVKIKSKKKKKRKKPEIKSDIRLNTRSSSEVISLDLDEEFAFSEKENVDSLLCGQSYEYSEPQEPLCKSWTPQMVQFYDEPWGEEIISLSELQRTMSDDGWKVDMSDEFYSLTSKFQNRRYFGVKSRAWCTKCNTKGHYRNECTEKTSPPRCRRCGSTRHQEYSCNQKICLTCGRNRSALVAVCPQCRQHSWKKCHICQQPGHPPGCCPDLWRRFHATIAPGEIVAPQKVSYKDPKNTYCCNCASRGHHVFQCKKDNFSDYTPMNPKVTSYVDPEVLLKFQSTCSRNSTNWESVGGIAPNYQSEEKGKDYVERGTKRCRSSGNQQKSKHRKLSESTAPKVVNTKIVSQKNSKKSEKSIKSKEIKNSVSVKIKKSLKPAKTFSKQHKCVSVDNKKQPNLNSELKKDSKHKVTATIKNPPTKAGIKGKEINAIDQTGSLERIIVLSPGHLKRIESDEGKHILKCVADQFKGVTATVVSNPSGILRLNGAGYSVDHFKANLFDILNNKCGVEQVKQSINSTGNDIRGKKVNKRTNAAMVRSKNVKKKFCNGAHQNNQLEMISQDQTNIAVSNSGDHQVKISRTRTKFKKNLRLKCSIKNGKGNKLNRQGKQSSKESALGNNDRLNPSFDPVVIHSTKTKCLSSSEVSKSCKYKGKSEILHNAGKLNEEATHTGMANPQSSHSVVLSSANQNGFKKGKKNKSIREMAKDKLRLIKVEGRKNGKGTAKKLKKSVANDVNELGIIRVEIGDRRKVSFVDESKYI